ncbi:MAG: bifunctional folylpolyglutamate synthase/dihydrofolate synthase [Actinobacteria bacterium]|nr:MAG: bifunctional folylpolyglutamate synthase/dihydrofolate synthase [Actinomycetota bacterium]
MHAARTADAHSPRIVSWTEERALAHLRSLELFGMRFGLQRMRALMELLGSPQRSFESIHVVGTNGKSSTTQMAAAILERHGVRTGAYTSPHLVGYRERIHIGARELSGEAFARAIARAAPAAERVDRELPAGERVTQFELLTAAAFCAMHEAGVQIAVIEAGLGGRYDATSVIDARVTALTSIGLEHTRWLGETQREIAEEKLAVVGRGATLALAARLAPEVLVVAERVARERGARLQHASERAPGAQLLARGAFQERNFALARLAAETSLLQAGAGLPDASARERAAREAAASVLVPGRLQLLDGDPPTVLDGAHNPAAVAALLESLPDVVGVQPLGLVFGVLDDKDAAGMLRPLAGRCQRVWLTAPASERAVAPAALVPLARECGVLRVVCEQAPARALLAAQEWARGQPGAVLACGSLYLVGELLEHIGAFDTVEPLNVPTGALK